MYKDEDGAKYTIDGVMMFKTGVKPKWEDPINKTGGEFKIDIGVKNEEIL